VTYFLSKIEAHCRRSLRFFLDHLKGSTDGGLFWPIPKVFSIRLSKLAAEIRGQLNRQNTKFENIFKKELSDLFFNLVP
jgi:hypothetical protein